MASSFTTLTLPVGLRRGVSLINKMDRKKFAQLSQRVIATQPTKDALSLFSDEERQKLVVVLELETFNNLSLVVGY